MTFYEKETIENNSSIFNKKTFEFNLKTDFSWIKKEEHSLIKLTGKDRNDLLNRLSATNLSNLTDKYFTPVILLNEKGRFIDFFDYLNFDNFSLISTSLANFKKTKLWINRYTITEDIQIVPFENEYSFYEFLGSKIFDALSFAFDIDLSNFENENFIFFDEFFYIYSFEKINNIKYAKAIIKNDRIDEFFNKLNLASTLYEILELNENDYEFFRIKYRIPKAPNEINDENNPLELNLFKYISFDKGCYIGQEVISRLYSYDKIQRTLVNFAIQNITSRDSSTPIQFYDELHNEIGISTTLLLKNDSLFGLALIRKKYLENSENRLFAKNKNWNKFVECEVNI